MKWSDLNQEQQSFLSAWFLLANAEPPSKLEDLPIEYSDAISELASVVGTHKRYRFQKMVRSGDTGCQTVMPNRRRIVRRRKAIGQLAS